MGFLGLIRDQAAFFFRLVRPIGWVSRSSRLPAVDLAGLGWSWSHINQVIVRVALLLRRDAVPAIGGFDRINPSQGAEELPVVRSAQEMRPLPVRPCPGAAQPGRL